jgi:hypothetical protein
MTWRRNDAILVEVGMQSWVVTASTNPDLTVGTPDPHHSEVHDTNQVGLKT